MDVDIPSRRISSGNAGGTPLYNPSKALTTGTTNRNNANGTCCESEISPPKENPNNAYQKHGPEKCQTIRSQQCKRTVDAVVARVGWKTRRGGSPPSLPPPVVSGVLRGTFIPLRGRQGVLKAGAATAARATGPDWGRRCANPRRGSGSPNTPRPRRPRCRPASGGCRGSAPGRPTPGSWP